MDLQVMYQNMNVAHLSVDEVEHELLIRNILYGLDEHESIKRRKLKDRMQHERESGSVNVLYCTTWRKMSEELSIILSKLTVIEDLLENPKVDLRTREKLKTRLVHYRVRIFSLSRVPQAQKYSKEVREIGKKVTDMFLKYFPDDKPESKKKATSKEPDKLKNDLSKALIEVRSEINVLNETASGKDLLDDEDGASGGDRTELDLKRQEMDESVQRSEEILAKLTEFEEGKIQNSSELIKHFKSFVMLSTKQQRESRQREIELEEKRRKEAEENIERKMRLERLLIDLNDKLKKEPTPKVENETDKEDMEEKDVKRDNIKVDDLKTHLRSDSSSESSGERKLKEMLKKKYKKKKNKKEKPSYRKTKKRTSFKSSSSYSSESTSSTSSSDLFSAYEESSSSSSDSPRPRRKNKKGKNRKEHPKPLKRVPVSEWRIRYDGKDNGRKLGEFLKEIKMRKKAENISDRELFRGALHLFTGRAKDWYMDGMENREFRNWSELKAELKREFLPPDLDFQLEIQATNRRKAEEKDSLITYTICRKFSSP